MHSKPSRPSKRRAMPFLLAPSLIPTCVCFLRNFVNICCTREAAICNSFTPSLKHNQVDPSTPGSSPTDPQTPERFSKYHTQPSSRNLLPLLDPPCFPVLFLVQPFRVRIVMVSQPLDRPEGAREHYRRAVDEVVRQ
jgi:hypothetical protein